MASTSAAALAPGAENAEEIFDVVDENDQVIRQEFRGVVHRTGLLHRSVNIVLFNTRNELLLQQRSPNKTVCPSAWDLSAAEHLQPGESYEAGARRGLAEELGLDGAAIELRLLRGTHGSLVEAPGIIDRELVQLWGARFDGAVAIDHGEVVAVRWVAWAELAARLAAADEAAMTPWLVREVRALVAEGFDPACLAVPSGS